MSDWFEKASTVVSSDAETAILSSLERGEKGQTESSGHMCNPNQCFDVWNNHRTIICTAIHYHLATARSRRSLVCPHHSLTHSPPLTSHILTAPSRHPVNTSGPVLEQNNRTTPAWREILHFRARLAVSP